jgi:conjugal transfer/type IV secretion protein DotA/TraY
MLPGILPRVNRLLFSGFGHLGVFIALAFMALRLLPPHHPYLNPANQGRFGVRHVLHEVRRRLIFDRNHSDQIVLYYTLLLGFVLLCAQFVMLAAALSVQNAHASDIAATMTSYFVTPNPTDDLAYNMLDRVFGFHGIYGSKSDTGTVTQLQTGLHMLLQFYNIGILIVAAIVFLYMITTVIAETSQSGVPFGRRFNGAWAPLRLIFAVGLLTPLPVGGEGFPSLNSGQLLTLYVAKWGSSFGTNSWFKFLDSINGETPLGQKDTLVVKPIVPPINSLAQFLFVAEVCANYQWLMYGKMIDGLAVNGNSSALYLVGPWFNGTTEARQALYTGDDAIDFATVTQGFTEHGNINLVFGEWGGADYSQYDGSVRPTCGTMVFQVKDLYQPGAKDVQTGWYTLLNQIWEDPTFRETALNIAKRYVPNELREPDAPVPSDGSSPDAFVKNILTKYQTTQINTVNTARDNEIKSPTWDDTTYRDMGWAAAGLWYNKLAETNGSFMAAVHDVPRGSRYTEVMENISAQKRQTDALVDPETRFLPYEAMGNRVDFQNPADKYEAMAEYTAQQIWSEGYVSPMNSSLMDVVRALFGLDDLFSMRDNIAAGVNPLAQIVGLGRGLLESSIQNLGYSFGASVVGGLANIIGLTPMKTIGAGVAKFTSHIGLLALSVGFLLFYVVPFMPFIYFFFSMTTWAKAIFTGLVGIPLWAIAHMRIDGEGLPGPLGMSGYYLLFEIFLRPALTVIGLLGGLTIFGAQAFILDEIWDLVIDNVTGFDHATGTADLAPVDVPTLTGGAIGGQMSTGTTTGAALGALIGARGTIDQFMYTILFAIVIYMMGLSSFKMADMVPDNVLRWMHAGVQSFGQFDPNPAEGAMGRVSEGLGMLTDRGNAPLLALFSRNS